MADSRHPVPSDVYLKAAEFIKDGVGHGCCFAICQAASNEIVDEALDDFIDLFKPDAGEGGFLWWWGNVESRRAQNQRILALCFMAAITEERHARKQR